MNWIVFAIIITIDKDYNNIITATERDRMKIIISSMIWN